MCGIAGFIGRGDESDLRRMTEALEHRGPDAQNLWSDPEAGVWLGHRRLAVVDLECGSQPMWTSDEALGVVFNGEIYNHDELRTELESRGHVFRSDHSDTEVLLHGYREWGAELVQRLNGMWAFAIFDTTRRRLFLSRDRFGQKPLYYSHQNGTFAFASELRALARHRQIESSRSRAALRKYFAYGYIPAPLSLFDRVYKLPGGHNLTVELGDRTPRASRYWEFELEPFERIPARAEQEWGEQLLELLARAVERRLFCDVPLGVFLSGGIDSSALAALAARALGSAPLRTFSIGFEEASFDESKWAEHVARNIGSQHHCTTFSVERARDVLPEVMEKLDEPLGDSSLLPTYLLCGEARKEVTVALGGDGGDELFAGYDPFHALRFADTYERMVPQPVHRAIRLLAARLPTSHRNISFDFKLKRTLAGLSYGKRLWNPVWMGPLEPAELDALFGEPTDVEEVYSEAIEAWERCENASLVDRTLQFFTRLYLQNDILTKVDRTSMMHSLEVRSPFLDIELVDFVRRVPHDFKFRKGETKFLLKRAMGSLLPDAVIHRSKKGFGVPIGRWFQEGQLSFDTVSSAEPPAEFRRRRLREHRAGRTDNRLYLFNHWLLDHYAVREGESFSRDGFSPQDSTTRDQGGDFASYFEKRFRDRIAPFPASGLKGKAVLDAGCGVGRNSYWAASYGARNVRAVDPSLRAVNEARQVLADVAHVAVECRNLHQLSFIREFDVCFSIGAIQQLEYPHLAVGKLFQALRPGGVLVIWLPSYERKLRVSWIVHALLRKLHPRSLRALGHLCSILLYLALKLPFPRSENLRLLKQLCFSHLHEIVVDGFPPEAPRYYEQHEVEELFTDPDLAKVEIHRNHGNGWTVICRK